MEKIEPIPTTPASKGTEPLNLDRLTDVERSALLEIRACADTWSKGNEQTADFAYNESNARAIEFLRTHPDAHDYAFFQALIGGADSDAFTKMDYPDGSILALVRSIDKTIRDRKTGNA